MDLNLSPLAWPVLYALAVWWLSTGVILVLNGLPRRTFPLTLWLATLLLVAALAGLVATRANTGASGAYCAFSCAILVWAWQELAFLLGVVTGPNRQACPPGLQGWARTRLALGAVLHHELALVVLAVAVWLAVGDGPNQVGWWTYLALWLMRQSAKLNLFLGARNLSEAFLPQHLKYMHSHFRRRRWNPLFPWSMAGTLVGATLVWQAALALPAAQLASAGPGLALLGTLLALGALEHALLLLPLPPETLWKWGLGQRSEPPVVADAAGLPVSPGRVPR